MNENWLDDIGRRLAAYEGEEPAHLWEDIEARLPQTERSKPVVAPWLLRMQNNTYVKVAAAAVLLTLIVSVGVFRSQQEEAAKAVPVAQATNTPVAEPTPVRATGVPAASAQAPRALARSRQTATPLPPVAPFDTASTAATLVVEKASVEATAVEDSVPQRRPTIESLTPPDAALLADSREGSSDKRNRIVLAAYMSGGLNASSGSQRDAAMSAAVGSEGASWEGEPMMGIMLYNQGLPTHVRYTHYMPIRAGVSVAWRFSKRVGVETGLIYSCLLSDYEDGSESHYMAGQQTLHYIGVPLNLTCDIYAWRKLAVYGSVGGTAEYCVGGVQRTDYVLNNQCEQTVVERISEHPWQFSATLAAGVQYNCLPWLGVYAEPGATYRFRDKSPLQSIYKQRPFNFSLNLGVRFTL